MIKLSKKWDYAVKTAIFLSKNKERFFTIWEVSKILNISESLLRRIIADLKKAKIITSTKWRNWGIQIIKDIQKISLFDIFLAVWEKMYVSDCTKWVHCENMSDCYTEDTYHLLQKWLTGLLKLYTLEKLIKK